MTDNRGGPRPGAGRPALDGEPIPTQIKLTAEDRATAAALGNGSMSAGVRLLLRGEITAECLELRRENERLRTLAERMTE